VRHDEALVGGPGIAVVMGHDLAKILAHHTRFILSHGTDNSRRRRRDGLVQVRYA
jgi:hypothetical protein